MAEETTGFQDFYHSLSILKYKYDSQSLQKQDLKQIELLKIIIPIYNRLLNENDIDIRKELIGTHLPTIFVETGSPENIELSPLTASSESYGVIRDIIEYIDKDGDNLIELSNNETNLLLDELTKNMWFNIKETKQ